MNQYSTTSNIEEYLMSADENVVILKKTYSYWNENEAQCQLLFALAGFI
jgi:hypothetical protein